MLNIQLTGLIVLACCLPLVRAVTAASAESEDELVLVQMMFRHGDRTPVEIYPNDPNKESVWDKYGGLGQLTQVGIQRHYNLGLFLRQRYESFLNATYSRTRVVVKSTNYDRTIMSAESLLASLYKPVDYQIWNSSLLWQPIPVRTADVDKVFIPSCPRYDELFDEVIRGDEFKRINNEYKDVIEIVNKESGYKDTSLVNLWRIADTSFIELNNNLTVPKWVQDNLNKIMESRDIDFSFKYFTAEMGRLTSGGILNDMKNNIKNVLKGNSSLQLALFSAHDTNIAAFIKLMGLSDVITAPPYASAILIELKKSKSTSKYYVLVFIKDNKPNEPIQLRPATILGCDRMCLLDDFMRIISNKTVENPSVECTKRGSGFKPLVLFTNVTFLVVIGFVALCTILVSACSIHTYRRIFKQRSGYLQQEL